ncbi:MAG: hypothetical protein COA85_02500 [Robiginitomaculum sp.]|nr:MAG: hypothetical protein COA85_02500 [Robiginitomaculum sp.]
MERYSRIAITLHWLIAGFIIALVPVGLFMEDTPKAIQVTVYQMHKSFGLMVLFLSLASVGWRLLNPPPPLPTTMKPWEKILAKVTHITFFVLILAIPLSGWMMVSASPKNIPTMFLTLFNWPHIWFLAQMAVEQKKAIVGDLHEVHEILAFGTMGLLVLHIGAALKHQYMDKDNAMARMLPKLGGTNPPTRKPRGTLLVFGGTALLFVLIALLGNTAGNAAPVPAASMTGEQSGNWVVDPATSSLSFAFNHAGNSVEGKFVRWNADISLDPADLREAHITAIIDLGSAHTGDATYDGALPEADWFDIATNNTAMFKSQDIRAIQNGSYVVDGRLSLRGLSLPVSFPFELQITGDSAHAEGTAVLDRLDFGIGANADPSAEYVERAVQVKLSLNATRRKAS